VTDGHRWQAFSRDGGYGISGGLPILSVKGVRRWFGVDTCELTTPYSPDAYGRLAPSCGIVVHRDGVQQFSGLVGSSRKIEWSRGGQATITVQCLGDDQHLADRVVLPSPLAAPDAQTADYWTFPRSDTLPLRTQAAQEIRQRILSGQPYFEDWSWRGMPAYVGAENDALTAAYWAETGKAWNDVDASTAWLARYVAANSVPVSGGRNAPASTAMWQLINEQVGPAASFARRVPALVMGADPRTGESRFWWEQFAPVLDTLSLWGTVSGANLGVRLTSVERQLRADVVAPRDMSAAVKFSANLTNLTGWEFEEQPPTVTHAIVAGQGDLRNRVRRWTDTTAAGDLRWGRRIEKYVDSRDEADVTKLTQTAADEVTAGGETLSLSLDATDTASIRYGDTWDLGDLATVYVGLPGGPTAATIVDLVREVAFEVNGRGAEKITPAVGTSDAKAIRPGPSAQAIGRLSSGLARLTRNK
jgi:hypothetical protein